MAEFEHQLGEKAGTVDQLHVRLEEVLQSRDKLQEQLAHTEEVLRRHTSAAPSQAVVRTAHTLRTTAFRFPTDQSRTVHLLFFGFSDAPSFSSSFSGTDTK